MRMNGDDQRPEKIRGMFTAVTPVYDRLNHLLSRLPAAPPDRATARLPV